MKTTTIVVTGVAAVAAVAAAAYMIDIDQTREARLPDVSINVEEGKLPAYEVNTGSVSVGQETVAVEVPKVEVSTETEMVEVPTLNIKPARENDG